MPVDQLDRARDRANEFVAERSEDRFVIYPEETDESITTNAEDPFAAYSRRAKDYYRRSLKPSFLMRKRERSRSHISLPRLVRRIRIGRATYPLRSPVIGFFQKGARGVAFRVDDLLPHFVGEGASVEAAYRDWCEHIHVFIQRMRATSPSLRNPEERRQWDMICNRVDMMSYERMIPIKATRKGTVTSTWPDAWQIAWADGAVEEVELEIMPDEFGAFEKGDAFEAAIDQDPETGRILFVYSMKPIVAEESPSQEKAIEFWSSLRQTVDLPESHRDWTK
jgi:hypothetical protein